MERGFLPKAVALVNDIRSGSPLATARCGAVPWEPGSLCHWAQANGCATPAPIISPRIADVHSFNSFFVGVLQSSALCHIGWESLVVDEGHRLRNTSSRLFAELRGVSVQHRLLLSGTPLQNNLAELFALLHFLEPRKFPDPEALKQRYGSLAQEEQVRTISGTGIV